MWLSCSGDKCVMTTNAMPVSSGSALKKVWRAVNAPAEPAIPTTVGPTGVCGAEEEFLGLFDRAAGLDFPLFFAADGLEVFLVGMGACNTF